MGVLLPALLLSVVWNSCARPPRSKTPLTIHPSEPLVEVGGSIQLHCSLACLGGKVQWEGLDTDLGDVISNHTTSILTVSKAAVSAEGTKICTGQCQGKVFQKTVQLQVYSLPDSLQLDSQPVELMTGQPAHLSCLVRNVYPSEAFTLNWFQGDERVERHVDKEMEDADLFTFRSKLESPMAEEQTTYRCEAQLQIGQHLFHQSRTLTIQAKETQPMASMTGKASSQPATVTAFGATPERPVGATEGTSSLATLPGRLPPLRSTEHPTVRTLLGAITAAPDLAFWTSPALGRSPSSGAPSPAQIPLGEAPAVSPEPAGGMDSAGTGRPVPETSAKPGVPSKALSPTDWTLAPKHTSPSSSLPTNSTAATGVALCRPVITPVPPQGTVGRPLRITCHAPGCSKDIQVRWVETPMAQSRYHQERAEGQSTLAVDRVSAEYQGVYRCLAMTSQPKVASVRLEVEHHAAFSASTVITIGAAGSLVGLFITSYVSRRLWQQRGS
ncbi:mucosal addressin cell adhesion molecule 1 [Paroedura picta]|uniref:mucosal addressin cell adhesion molecule 1 n=1 Tax=Paroedura picta TaxID=143630 RepID=UPI004056EFD4